MRDARLGVGPVGVVLLVVVAFAFAFAFVAFVACVDPRWIAGMVRFWLDEEWERGATVNARVGDAVAASFAARVDAMDAREEEPLQRLVFGLAEDLLSFDFSDTFVSAFEVSNKVIEMLMLRAGIDVCCVGEEDVTRADRYEASLRASTE